MRRAPWLDHRSPVLVALVMIAAAVILRYAALGDPNIFLDEGWYLEVGHEMHLGAVPYVDIWDRKPLGLFLLYWLFAGSTKPFLTYQLAALASVAVTAFLLTRIAGRWCRRWGALFTGIAYIALVNVMGGSGGQGPVYYNALVAGAAALLLRWRDERSDWALLLAMGLLGVAITFKQTVFFEAVFFGLWSVWQHRSPRLALASVMLGALPFLAFAAWYAWHGYWAQFYHAMVTANLTRPIPRDVIAANAHLLAIRSCVLALVVLQAMLFQREDFDWKFVGLWLVAALIGFLSVPFFVEHYALPLLLPTCLAASAVFDRERFGPILAGTVIGYAIIIGRPFDVAAHRRATEAMRHLADISRPSSPNGTLFLYDAPAQIYMLTGTRPLSPLAFPAHLHNHNEKNTSYLNSGGELRRIIRQRPEVVVMSDYFIEPPDWASYQDLLNYVQTCNRPIPVMTYKFAGWDRLRLIYRDCGKVKR